MTSDKRAEPRYEVSSTVPASWSGGGPVDCAASDISRNGIFLEMEAPPPVETAIRVGVAEAAVGGRVVFSLGASDAAAMGRKPGVGVQLDAPIDPDTFLLRCAEARAALAAIRPGGSGAVAPALQPKRPSAVATRVAVPGTRAAATHPAPVEELVSDVVLVEGVPGQAAITEALVADGYTPLVAKHGFEALILCIRRRPLLCVADGGGAPLSGRRLLDEVRGREDLADVTVILVDGSAAADPATPRTYRWRAPPPDVDKARRLVDAALSITHAVTRVVRATDAHVLADAVSDLARRLDADGETDAAAAAVRYAAELAPTASSHTLLLARILLAAPEQKRRDEAAVLIERVARQDPRSPEAYLLRAFVLDQRGRRDEARAALRRTLMFSPSDPEALLALEHLEAGQPLVETRHAVPSAAPEGTEKRGLFGKLFKR